MYNKQYAIFYEVTFQLIYTKGQSIIDIVDVQMIVYTFL